MERIEVVWSEEGLAHETGTGVVDSTDPAFTALVEEPDLHYENALRLRNMKAALERGGLAARLDWRDARRATLEEVRAIHTAEHVAFVEEACAASRPVAPYTPTVPASWGAALSAAGAAIQVADAALGGHRAYALVRPPGHHAQPARADGYCIFSNTAIAAEHAIRTGGAERVAVLDWDVHHGNGTQECFYDRPDVLTVSWHMAHGSWGSQHPQTGSAYETGLGRGKGYNINLNLRLGVGDAGYLKAFHDVVGPVVQRFAPDLILVASGQDASCYDPNGRQNVTMAGFRGLGAATRALADEVCGGRLGLVQEGGYARTYAAFCLLATLEGVLGAAPSVADPGALYPDDPTAADEAITSTRQALWRQWAI